MSTSTDLSPSEQYANQFNQNKAAANEARQKELDAQRAAQQAAVANQNQPSWFSTLLDKAWTDDFSAVPVIGSPVSGIATGVTAGYNALASAASLGQSWLPGGIQTFTWDQARSISPAQAGLADAAARRTQGGLLNEATAFAQTNALGPLSTAGTVAQQQVSELRNPGFDVTQDAQRQQAFESGGYGQILSGATDAAFQFFVDPLVVVGKGVKVARFGSEALGIQGATRLQLTTPEVAQYAERELDKAVEHMNGVPGAERSFMNDRIDAVVRMNGSEAEHYDAFQNSVNMPFLRGIVDTITEPHDAATFWGAAMGIPKYIERLRSEQTAAYDVLTRANNVDLVDSLHAATAPHQIPVLFDDVLEHSVPGDALIQDLMRRDQMLSAAVGLFEPNIRKIDELGSRSQGITKFGAVWNAGKAHRAEDATILQRATGKNVAQTDAARSFMDRTNVATTPEQLDDYIREGRITAEDAASIRRSQQFMESTGPAAYERIFQISASFRKVGVWSWITGEHATGWMDIRGIGTGNSVRELNAALGDSPTIRGDAIFRKSIMNAWSDAILSGSPGARLEAVRSIESAVARRLAVEHGADPEVMGEIYKVLDNRRSGSVDHFSQSNSAFAVDPDTGNLITLDPVFRSQLDTKIPMLDFRLLEKTAKLAARPEYRGLGLAKAAITMTNLVDQVVSLWKASVLFRLGYTVRNVAEGWLRSAASLGTVPAIEAAPRGLQRVTWTNRGFAPRGRMAKAIDYRQGLVSDNLAAVQFQRRAAEAELSTEREHAQELASRKAYNNLRTPDSPFAGTAGAKTSRRKPTADEIDAETARILEAEHGPRLAGIQDDINTLAETETTLANRMSNLNVARKKYGKRRLGDDAAFSDANADLYRELSSANSTVERVLESRWGRETSRKMAEGNYVKVAPGDPQYYDELSRAVEQMRNDPAAIMAMEGKSPKEISDWIMSSDGFDYRAAQRLNSQNAQGRAKLVHDVVNNYLPTDAARLVAARDARDLSILGPRPEELRALLEGSGAELQPVHGRAIANDLKPALTVQQAINRPINWIFKQIGSRPESFLVRHPFYNEVWQRRVKSNENIALSRLDKGETLSDETIRAIQLDAHAHALKAVNSTLYTIDRYSNPAQMLRFIAPFYPAWENSMKVWAGIIAHDPSVAARAALIYGGLNEAGMIVDEKGNPAPSDPFGLLSGSANRFIKLPKPLQDLFAKYAGGAEFKIPQGSLNVVSPGSSPWLPGFGPLVTVPTGMVLESKPDTQKMMRSVLGDAIYEQFVPFGEATSDLSRSLLPPALRKEYQRWQGESNQDYLAVVDSMMQTAMVDWYKSGGAPHDKPSMDEVRQKANDFYRFSSIASLTLPVSLTRTSKYQDQIDWWNNLKATPGTTYQQKIEAFLTKYGESYLPLVTSTSVSASKNLDPTIETFNVLNANKGLVAKLSQLGPESIGILGATAPIGQFDQGVYGYYLTSDVPGMPGEAYKSRVSPAEMQDKIQLAGAWRDYMAAKAKRDSALAARGSLSIDAKVNADIKAQWTDFTDNWMTGKYGATWTVAYNSYQSNQAQYLEGVNTVLRDRSFMSSTAGQSPLWNTVKSYMDVRQRALDAIATGSDSKLVSDQFAAWADNYRFTSLEFSDFYDNYLANDKLSIGVTSVG